ncbi:MAG: YkvA family protein [Rhodospirillales bacterium]
MIDRPVDRLKGWARTAKRDVLAVYLAARDPRVPWWVKALALVTAAYALSPIDLIPDFIPVIGYLDDLILVPLAIVLIVRLVPAEVMAELRAEADKRLAGARPQSRVAAAVIVALWVAAGAGIVWLIVSD